MIEHKQGYSTFDMTALISGEYYNKPEIIGTRKYIYARNKRTPAWADRQKINAIYNDARQLTKETGIYYQVDHIIPLQGLNVSGLHVDYNLQIIEARQNQLKGNKHN